MKPLKTHINEIRTLAMKVLEGDRVYKSYMLYHVPNLSDTVYAKLRNEANNR
jgi:hypothetical protein